MTSGFAESQFTIGATSAYWNNGSLPVASWPLVDHRDAARLRKSHPARPSVRGGVATVLAIAARLRRNIPEKSFFLATRFSHPRPRPLAGSTAGIFRAGPGTPHRTAGSRKCRRLTPGSCRRTPASRRSCAPVPRRRGRCDALTVMFARRAFREDRQLGLSVPRVPRRARLWLR